MKKILTSPYTWLNAFQWMIIFFFGIELLRYKKLTNTYQNLYLVEHIRHKELADATDNLCVNVERVYKKFIFPTNAPDVEIYTGGKTQSVEYFRQVSSNLYIRTTP